MADFPELPHTRHLEKLAGMPFPHRQVIYSAIWQGPSGVWRLHKGRRFGEILAHLLKYQQFDISS